MAKNQDGGSNQCQYWRLHSDIIAGKQMLASKGPAQSAVVHV